MLPKTHIISGFILSVLIYLIFHISFFHASLIFLSSFLIDFDHYLRYFLIKKDLSFENAYRKNIQRKKEWLKMPVSRRKSYKRPLFIFHGIEFIFLLAIFSFFSSFFVCIIIGIVFHLILDYAELIYFKEPLYSKFSQLYVYNTNKKKKKIDYYF